MTDAELDDAAPAVPAVPAVSGPLAERAAFTRYWQTRAEQAEERAHEEEERALWAEERAEAAERRTVDADSAPGTVTAVDRATGVVMALAGLEAEAAFAALGELTRRTGLAPEVVADRIVACLARLEVDDAAHGHRTRVLTELLARADLPADVVAEREIPS